MAKPRREKVDGDAYRVAVTAMRLGIHVVAVLPEEQPRDDVVVDLEVGGAMLRANMKTIRKLMRWHVHNVPGRARLSWTGTVAAPSASIRLRDLMRGLRRGKP